MRINSQPSNHRQRCHLFRVILLGAFLVCFGSRAFAVPATPLHTAGPYIVDNNGLRVRLNAVSWYGAESTDFVVGGLQASSLTGIVNQIKSQGFNAVRLPWSNQMYESNPTVGSYALAANTNLEGEAAMTIFDQVVNALTGAGLMVILDNHTSSAEWCCGDDGNDLWYNAQYPESSWLSDWEGMVSRYANNPLVIGVDLRNEPRITATWGGAASTDWHAAAERGGNAVLGVNSKLLIFVEGVNYALDLSGAASAPISLNTAARLVYEAHDYGFDDTSSTTYADYVNTITPRWGYLITGSNPEPLWVGEFGTCNTAASCVSSSSSSDNGQWFGFITTYLQENSADWSYWSINGTQSTGSGRTYGAAESYGILNTIWSGSSLPALSSALAQLASSGGGPANGTYAITNVNSGQAMEVLGQSKTDGAEVDQYPFYGGTSQQWTLNLQSAGMYTLENVNSNLVLDVPQSSISYGTGLDQWPSNGGGNQLFVITHTPDEHYRLVNANSGLVVEVPGGSTTDDAALDQWGWNAGTNQEWGFSAP